MSVTIRSRPSAEELPAVVEDVLRDRLDEPSARVVSWQPAERGFSTETFLFAVHDIRTRPEPWQLVLRRTPEIGLFPDYDLLRQVRVMNALAATEVPVPKVLWLDRTGSNLGSPYFVMEHVPSIGTASDIPSYHATGLYLDVGEQGRKHMWEGYIDTLTAIHRLDWRGLGLEWMTSARASRSPLEPVIDYVERTLPWAHPEYSSTTRSAVRFLRDHTYTPAHVSLCWGDARLSNLLFTEDLGVAAVLDWETSYIGDNEADLAWALFLDWASSTSQGLAPLPGTPTREELVALYEEKTGWTVKNLLFNEILAVVLLTIPLLRLARRFDLDDPNSLTRFCDDRLQQLLA